MSKKIEKCQTITCRMTLELSCHLKKIAISMSKQEGRVISLSEFIRETMSNLYPIPKQTEMFEEKKQKRLRKKILS